MVESNLCKAVSTLRCKESSPYTINGVVVIFHHNSSLVENIEKPYTAMKGMKTPVCEQRQLLMAI